ncbi:MAG: TIGR03936 family radical SAM-associated protein [Kineosporiaceae bacterium]
MQRLRIRFAKRGRLRFTSHRDFQRALERAVRRAGVPVAYSAGFSPHPRISYAGAAPTGAASEAEYLEIALTRVEDPERVRAALDAALPDGLDVLAVVPAEGAGFAERLQASHWQIEMPGLGAAELGAAVDAFLARGTVEVQRRTKSGLRTFDVRGAVVVAEVADRVAQVDGGPCAILRVVVRHTTPAVRPDDVLTAVRSQADLAPPSPPRMTRLAQGPLDGTSGAVADPLAPGPGVVGA